MDETVNAMSEPDRLDAMAKYLSETVSQYNDHLTLDPDTFFHDAAGHLYGLAHGLIVANPQRYVVVDTSTGIVQSDPMTFDEAHDEMMSLGATYYPDENGSINLGITEDNGMKIGEECGDSGYGHPDSWTYQGETEEA